MGERCPNVRAHAVFVDEFAARSEVFCRGEPSSGAIWKRNHTLHRSLAECGLPDEERATKVLKRPGDNLRFPLALA